MNYIFKGKWISNDVFCSEHRNQHILFRRKFSVSLAFREAKLYISADDYYKLYINGTFVAQGPSPSYHFQYNYNEIDVTQYLRVGENQIAVHTLYQGLINRVWQSGDFRHGLICDLLVDGCAVLVSDGDFLVANHSGYRESGTCGYDTQFLESYDSRAKEVGFERPDFDDGGWQAASICRFDDHILTAQKSYMLEFEEILPKRVQERENRVLYDFGSNYVGYLSVKAKGNAGDEIMVRCAQELNEDGSLRYRLRANCMYEEKWILADGESMLDQFDYKAFRYAELIYPDSATVETAVFRVRHYPFTLHAKLKN